MNSIIINLITQNLGLSKEKVRNTISLLADGSTVPFIARYRKEATGSLDEVAIRDIEKENKKLKGLIERKELILGKIKEQGALTDKLKSKIENCWDPVLLEDIYLPYKKKIKTKATVARENGLEPLAEYITQQKMNDLIPIAQKYVNKKVPDINAAFQGAQHIISEWVNENEKCRELIRAAFNKDAFIQSKVIKNKKDEATKYEMYFDYEEKLNKIPSHRLLALFRGETEKLLRVKVIIDEEQAGRRINRLMISNPQSPAYPYIITSIEDALKRLLLPSIENEARKAAKQKADTEAINVFSKNLRDLLLSAPLGPKRILALDPGFRTGCKVAVLDETGMLHHDTAIYPHPPQSNIDEASASIQHLVHHHNIQAIAIGNGTAGKETVRFIKNIKFDHLIDIYFVNENGASIYSASEIAREEFPDKDITVRGAVSIGRRLMDPLAELVKIDAKSIGVGQYQHDVDQNLLKEKLNETVTDCVHAVGININTASQHILTHLSGLGPVLAKNIIDYRSDNGTYNNIKTLLKVPRMGKKSYEQSAGFLRVVGGKHPLDNTGVHPERYNIVEAMAKDQNCDVATLINSKDIRQSINLNKYINADCGRPTLIDIMKELDKPGLDPRGAARPIQFSDHINTIDDVSAGMILPGIVNNVTKFGAFIDIGIKESGLVHISEITNRFINDPAEILSVNQEVKVKVLNVDKEKKRVSLSIKQV
jgi:uncharacterized protein